MRKKIFCGLAVGLLGLSGCSSTKFGSGEATNSSTTASEVKATSDSAASTSTAKDKTEETTASSIDPQAAQATYESINSKYEAIALGDFANEATGGATLEEVKAAFGEPKTTSTSDTDGKQVTLVEWPSLEDTSSALLTVLFINDGAYSKTISGLPVAADKKVTLKQYEAFSADGSKTLADAIKEFGKPDGFSENMNDGKTISSASWTTNVKGSTGANISLQVEDDKVTLKFQNGLE